MTEESLASAADSIMGVQVVKAAMDFENAMARLRTQTGASPEQVEKIKGAVLSLASVSELSPAQAADAVAQVLAEEPEHDLLTPDVPLVPYKAGEDTRIRKGFPRIQVDEARIEGQVAYRLSTVSKGEAVEQWTPLRPR